MSLQVWNIRPSLGKLCASLSGHIPTSFCFLFSIFMGFVCFFVVFFSPGGVCERGHTLGSKRKEGEWSVFYLRNIQAGCGQAEHLALSWKKQNETDKKNPKKHTQNKPTTTTKKHTKKQKNHIFNCGTGELVVEYFWVPSGVLSLATLSCL